MGRRVTRDVTAAEVADLAHRPPRTHLAYVEDGAPCVRPARTAPSDAADDRERVGVRGAPSLDGREVQLVRDSGRWWFELRALAVRGVLHRDAAPPGADRAATEPAAGDPDGTVWYRLAPTRTVAWDYGRLRRTDDG